MHVEYDDLSGFTVEADDENIILLYGENKSFGLYQYHYAFNELDYFLKGTVKKYDFLITFVDDSLVERLKSVGYEMFAIWRDYFNHDISSYDADGGIEYLKKAGYKRASDITMACKGQSRGFMGQTEEWIADWMESGKTGVSDAAILTHSEDGETAGIVFVGIYGHESEKGAVLWVRELAVHPGYQRRGIAKKLMRQALGYGKTHGAKRAFLMADEMNLGAIRLYEKMGFVRDENDCEINMVKTADKKEA